MVFSSIAFLYFFLPVVLILYFVVPKKAKNAVLLLSSLVFYFFGEQMYVLLMIANIVSAYIFGLLAEKFRGRAAAKVFLALSIIVSVLTLGFFKYSDFFIESVNSIFGTGVGARGLILPIGISFYTFQTMSYVIDVYRGDAKAQKNIINLATYVSLFPQLIAGPIVRYTEIENELTNRRVTLDAFTSGIFRFAVGMAKKVIIADNLYRLTESFRASDEKSVVFSWIYAVAFSLYIYYDFSGYSDMAIGLGKMFGFTFPENFNYPYISKSVTEFWRRWHITLGSWFRDYLYIPLGGNRVKLPRWIFNIFVVWMLTGLWHGASWNFVLWGLYFGVLLILEKLFLQKLFERIPRVFSHIYLVLAVVLGFVLFNAPTLGAALGDIGAMFGAGGLPLWTGDTGYYLSGFAVLLAISAVGATPLVKTLILKIYSRPRGEKVMNVLRPAALCAILLLCTAYFADNSFSPFLYFRF